MELKFSPRPIQWSYLIMKSLAGSHAHVSPRAMCQTAAGKQCQPSREFPFQASPFILTTTGLYQTTVVSRQRMHSVPIGCWPSEAFWQVYIVRQSFPRRSGDQAIQRSLLQHNGIDALPLEVPEMSTKSLHLCDLNSLRLVSEVHPLRLTPRSFSKQRTIYIQRASKAPPFPLLLIHIFAI
jgi:hypothetical protein